MALSVCWTTLCPSSQAKSGKGAATFGSRRRVSVADGMYLGGLLNGTPNQYVQLNSAGITLEDLNGNVIAMQ